MVPSALRPALATTVSRVVTEPLVPYHAHDSVVSMDLNALASVHLALRTEYAMMERTVQGNALVMTQFYGVDCSQECQL